MNATNEPTRIKTDKLIADVLSIGKTWARYGLSAGKMALDASATTLHKTASLLGELSSTLGESEPSDAKARPETADPPEDATS